MEAMTKEVQTVQVPSQPDTLRELSDLQLSLIGGGIGEVVVG